MPTSITTVDDLSSITSTFTQTFQKIDIKLKDIKNQILLNCCEIPANARTEFKSYEKLSSFHYPPVVAKLRSYATDNYGFLRCGEYYCVAMGTYYENIGKKFLIRFDTGKYIKVLICDQKSDQHTDPKHQYMLHKDNLRRCDGDRSVLEFIVNDAVFNKSNSLSARACITGDISSIRFSGKITLIYKLE